MVRLYYILAGRRLDSGSYECLACNKIKTNLKQIKEHLISHINMKKYICIQCFYDCNGLSNMKRHTRRRTRESNNNLNYIFHSFYEQQPHSGIADVRPYNCEHCISKFSRRSSLKWHMTKVHKANPRYRPHERREIYEQNPVHF